jgi:hypothetical protein
MFTPAPHPDTECPFYRGAFQNFLIALTPLPNGDPALVNYPTLDDAFQSTIPHRTRNTGTPYPVSARATVGSGPPTGRAWLGAVRQAGQRNVLVDQDNHTLYYGLHMNQAFYDFIQAEKLNTVNGILNVDPNLSFPPGLVEFKTAWKDIDPQDFPDSSGHLGTPNGIVPPPPQGDFGPGSAFAIPNPGPAPTWDANYITTTAWVPYLTQDPASGTMLEDRDHPLLRKVALVAIHSVYTLPGHPEFVWGSIQHVNLNAYDPAPIAFAGVYVAGAPDSQPDTSGPNGAAALPAADDPQNASVTAPPSQHDYLLYKGGTPENTADQPIVAGPVSQSGFLKFDEPSQSFPGQAESVYRMFPGSKADTLQPDSAVFSLNSNLNTLFGNAMGSGAMNAQIDKRFNYRLVAAVWMDKPSFFGLGSDGQGQSFQNDETNPLVIGAQQNPPNIYPNVSQGVFCGTPLDSTDTSGDSPKATGANNTVPGCSTRADDLAKGDNPATLYQTNAVGTDYEFSLLGGEDRLSSTSMETFTQNNTFHNCFACHNTLPISTNGTPYTGAGGGGSPLITKAAMINVSHLFSEFVLRDQEEVAAAGIDAGTGDAGN